MYNAREDESSTLAGRQCVFLLVMTQVGLAWPAAESISVGEETVYTTRPRPDSITGRLAAGSHTGPISGHRRATPTPPAAELQCFSVPNVNICRRVFPVLFSCDAIHPCNIQQLAGETSGVYFLPTTWGLLVK